MPSRAENNDWIARVVESKSRSVEAIGRLAEQRKGLVNQISKAIAKHAKNQRTERRSVCLRPLRASVEKFPFLDLEDHEHRRLKYNVRLLDIASASRVEAANSPRRTTRTCPRRP